MLSFTMFQQQPHRPFSEVGVVSSGSGAGHCAGVNRPGDFSIQPTTNFSRALCKGKELLGMDKEACCQRCVHKNSCEEKEINKEKKKEAKKKETQEKEKEEKEEKE